MDQFRKANGLVSKFASRLRATNWELIEKRQVERFLVELSRALSPVGREVKPEK